MRHSTLVALGIVLGSFLLGVVIYVVREELPPAPTSSPPPAPRPVANLPPLRRRTELPPDQELPYALRKTLTPRTRERLDMQLRAIAMLETCAAKVTSRNVIELQLRYEPRVAGSDHFFFKEVASRDSGLTPDETALVEKCLSGFLKDHGTHPPEIAPPPKALLVTMGFSFPLADDPIFRYLQTGEGARPSYVPNQQLRER